MSNKLNKIETSKTVPKLYDRRRLPTAKVPVQSQGMGGENGIGADFSRVLRLSPVINH
jgi:hypothetical protein